MEYAYLVSAIVYVIIAIITACMLVRYSRSDNHDDSVWEVICVVVLFFLALVGAIGNLVFYFGA